MNKKSLIHLSLRLPAAFKKGTDVAGWDFYFELFCQLLTFDIFCWVLMIWGILLKVGAFNLCQQVDRDWEKVNVDLKWFVKILSSEKAS